jgi:sec-independent protein translocase protein TatB
MLPGIGSSELFVIALVALIVVGPKDLPGMLRKLGQFVSKMRSMANDFRPSFDEMARQSELDELRKEVEALRSGSYMNPLRDAQSEQIFADIDASLQAGGVQFPPVSYQPESAAEQPALSEAPAEKPKRRRAPKAAAVLVEEAAPARKPRASRKKAETPS